MSRSLLPRQSAQSGGAATESAVATTSGGQASASASATAQSSPLTTTTDVVQTLTQVTNSAATTTTTPDVATTTSASPATSSSPSESSGNSQTPPPTSSSIPRSTTDPASSSSSSPETTTQPPTSSPPSQQETQTTFTSFYTTYVNGTPVPTETVIPSTIPVQLGPSSSNRAAIIGGSAAGGTAILILLLTLAFCARRKQFKRLNFLQTIMLKRKQIHSRATLLDGEDLATVEPHLPQVRYTNYETTWDGSDRALMAGEVTPHTPYTSSRPFRRSESGSAFREDIWHPPHEDTHLMDPLSRRNDPDLDLSRIVDDVMGPSASAAHFSDRSVSSMYRDSVAVSDGVVHSRTVSTTSNLVLLEAAGLSGPSARVRPSPLAAQPQNNSTTERQAADAS